jgi:predicted nucleic-acid-binding Zn-ribbon protein
MDQKYVPIVQNWLQNKGKNFACPVCQKTGLFEPGEVLHIPTGAGLPAERWKVVTVVCKECGYTAFIKPTATA